MKNFLDDKNAAYDALAKKVLSRKAILAQILKFSVKEFSDCTLEDIEGKYIKGDPSLNINTIPLDDSIYRKRAVKAHCFSCGDETPQKNLPKINRSYIISLDLYFI